MSDDILLPIPRYGPLPDDIYSDESFPRNLRLVQNDLCGIIDLDYGLLDELFSLSALSDEEVAMLRWEKTPELMNQRMLEILVNNPDRVGRFMACLQRTLQIHVFNYIRYKGVLEKGFATDVWPMSEEHKSRLKASHRHLVEFVLSDIEFVHELHSSHVFTTRHKQHVDICKTNADRNRRILETMDRRSIADLKNYVNCLVKTRQEHLAPLLTQNTAMAELHADISITGEGNVDEAIAHVVSEFDLMIRERNMERDEEDVAELHEALHRLGDQVRLIAFRQSSGITVYILCLSLTSVQQLHEIYLRGDLKSIIEDIFAVLLRTKSRPVVNIRQLEWSSSNYGECLRLLQMTPGWTFTPLKGGVPAVTKSYMTGNQAARVITQLVVKTAWLQLPDRLKLSSRVVNTVLATFASVCSDWHRVMCDLPVIRRLVHRRLRQLCLPFRCHPKSVSSPQIVDGSSMRGVTVLANRLYVITRASAVIQVFENQAPHRRLADVRVSGMLWPRDIASCSLSNRLFIVDAANKCIFRVDDPTSGVRVTRWAEHRHIPHAVSVRADRVLVTPNVFFHRTLRLCDCNGKLLLGVELPDYMEPRHAVETSRSTFLVCHTGRENTIRDQVSEIDGCGAVVRSFGGRRGGTPELLRFPRHLAIDASDRVLVADSGNRRVQLLDTKLSLLRVLLDSDDKKLCGEPNRLCFDFDTGRLIVCLRSSYVQTFIVK